MKKYYYTIKPFIPRWMQISLRRHLVRWQRERYKDVWPIHNASSAPPENWAGWPDGKKFALVLTHDVDTEKGQQRCRQLAEMEMELGFRSSFNFVPKRYSVSADLRRYLVENGFEVGVHGLYHDGKYYHSREEFKQRAKLINQYLREWNAVGFRSPSMLHNLEWILDLDIEYDSSTFDTDPFEPQADGVHTIFPFIVRGGNGRRYVELPYTLPQDFTLFVLMKEKGIDVWKTKLQWVAERGGMALVNAHPDYMNFSGAALQREEYPSEYYRDFLAYVKAQFGGQYWGALPREVAQFAAEGAEPVRQSRHENIQKLQAPKIMQVLLAPKPKKKIWIDLENTPHVPFFKPIMGVLEAKGYEMIITARDCFQVCGLADLMHVPYRRIGKHYGKNKVMKVAGLIIRSCQLKGVMQNRGASLAVSHGSRTQTLASKMLGIPSLVIGDYEHAIELISPDWLMMPEVIRNDNIRQPRSKILYYPGIKEDVYVPDFKPDPTILNELALPEDHLIITVRPPATEAHYHNPEAEVLFAEVMDYFGGMEKTTMVLLPRNAKQEEEIRQRWHGLFSSRKAVIPDHAVEGLNLMWHSDLVISGGGTMNREAAALGIPVYSIFRGPTGAVDRYLTQQGRLVMLQSAAEVRQRIKVERREKEISNISKNRRALDCIVNEIVRLVETQTKIQARH